MNKELLITLSEDITDIICESEISVRDTIKVLAAVAAASLAASVRASGYPKETQDFLAEVSSEMFISTFKEMFAITTEI